MRSSASAITPIRSRPSGPKATRRCHARWLMKCLAVAGFAAMNIMLLSVSVWSGNVTDMTPGDARPVPLAVGADRAAGRRLCGPAVLSERAAARCARGSVNMDVPISLGVVLALGMSLVETANHAEHAYFDSAVMLLFFLLCGRYLDHAMRRKTRAVAGNLAALKAEVAHRFERRRRDRHGAGRGAASPATGCWCGRASGCRPTAS